MKLVFSSFFLVFFTCCQIELISQTTSLKGIVLDSHTHEPLPFVNIIYNDKNNAFATDIDGKFIMQDLSKVNFLKFIYVGYAAKIINKEILGTKQFLTIYLEQESYNLSEVTIHPSENPAHRIIKKVLENRKINNPEELSSYSYTSYNKMYFTIDFRKTKKLFNDTSSKADTVKVGGSIQKMKKILESRHVMLIESITEKYYKKPGKSKEKVLASVVSGLKEPSFILLATQMQSFSFYTDMITLLKSRYVSPISEGSTNRYFFNIEDTTYSKSGDTVFCISYKPKRNRNFEALEGVLYINTNKYAIQSVIAEPVDDDGLINLRIVQNYEMVDGQHWFPVELNTDLVFSSLFDVKFGNNKMKLIGRGKTYLSNIKINSNDDKVNYKAIELEANDLAFKRNDTIWAKYRRDNLTRQEMNTYRIMDSVGHKENFDSKIKAVKSLSEGYLPIYFLDIDIASLFDFNVFEGYRPGLGFRTNKKISKIFTLGTYAAYGYNDKKWKYGGDLNLNLSIPNQVQVGFSYKKDVAESSGVMYFEDQMVYNPTEEYREYFISDMTYIEEYKTDLSFRALKKFRFNLYARQFEMQNISKYSFYYSGDFDPVNSCYNFQEVGLQIKYSPNESLANMAGELYNMKSYNSPILYFNVIRGIKGTYSDFDYLKLEAKVNVNFITKTFGRTSLLLSGAEVYGDLPYFMLYGGHGSYYDFAVETANSFETMRMNEFLSDKFVSLYFRQDFGGLLFKGEKFRPKFILCNNIGFGMLDKPALHQGIEYKTMEKGYYETGLIINSLIRVKKFIGFGFGTFYRYGPYSFSNINDNFAYKMTLTFDL